MIDEGKDPSVWPATAACARWLHREFCRRLPRGSFMVLREAALAGEVERSRVPMLTGYEERAARMVTSALVKRGMLVAVGHRAPLKLGFPADVVERWLPKLYPADAGRRP